MVDSSVLVGVSTRTDQNESKVLELVIVIKCFVF